jgi:hypothetical protein
LLAAGLAMLSVTVSALPRISLAAGTLPDAARPFVWSDVLATYLDRLAGGRIPYFESFFEYPPIVGYIAGAFVRSTSGPVGYLALWSALSAITAGLVALLLARAAGPRRAIAFWSLSPQLLLYGAANFDVLAVALLVWAVLMMRAGRPLAAFVSLAAGAATKAFPIAAAPLELGRMRRERGAAAPLTAASVFVVVSLAIGAPALLAPHSIALSAGYLLSLTNFDSAWGLVQAGLSGLGVADAAVIVRIASATGMAATYIWLIARCPASDPARRTAFGLLAVLIWSTLYSPQYSLWVLPFVALLVSSARVFTLLCLADLVVFLTVYPLTLVRWPAGDTVAPVLLAALWTGVVLRHVALVWMWRDLSRRDTRPSVTGATLAPR